MCREIFPECPPSYHQQISGCMNLLGNISGTVLYIRSCCLFSRSAYFRNESAQFTASFNLYFHFANYQKIQKKKKLTSIFDIRTIYAITTQISEKNGILWQVRLSIIDAEDKQLERNLRGESFCYYNHISLQSLYLTSLK